MVLLIAESVGGIKGLTAGAKVGVKHLDNAVKNNRDRLLLYIIV